MPELSQETERGRAVLPFGRPEVTGPSMVPRCGTGIDSSCSTGRGSAGGRVVLRHPFQQDLLVVKRIAERREGGWWCSRQRVRRWGQYRLRHRARGARPREGAISVPPAAKGSAVAVRAGALGAGRRQACCPTVSASSVFGRGRRPRWRGWRSGPSSSAGSGWWRCPGRRCGRRCPHRPAVDAVFRQVEGQPMARSPRNRGRVRRVVRQVHVPHGRPSSSR